MMKSCLLAAVVVLVLFSPSSASDFVQSQSTFDSGGKKITIDLFEPKAAGKHPAVVLVHRADSLVAEEWKLTYHKQARHLALRNFVVLMPHYLERTDTKLVDTGNMINNFTEWSKTVGDAVTFATTRTNVDDEHIGLVRTSLGGTLVLSECAFDPRVGAVVDFFGTLPDWVLPAAKEKRDPELPPILILHGDTDRLVSVKEAHKLEDQLKSHKIPYEIKI